MSKLTASQARHLFDYDPDSGSLRWAVNRPRNPFKGRKAGWVARHSHTSYLVVTVDSTRYLAHRVIWLMVFGQWPKHSIDHINGDGLDNRIENLRDVTHDENQKNKRIQSVNTSGVNGVHWDKAASKWRVKISAGGKRIHIGRFKDFNEAKAAVQIARMKYGYHENHGKQREAP